MTSLDPKSEAQIALRLKMGDRLDEPRLVDHTALFPRRKHAEAAAEDLGRLGFEVAVSRNGLLGARVEATREDAVDAESVASFLGEVTAVTRRHGGTYDGWGADLRMP